MRNVVQTVAALPERLNTSVHFVVNDRDFDVVARNAILLLYVLVSLQDCINESTLTSLAESLMHLWYSAFLPEELSLDLRMKVHPLIHQANESYRGMDPTGEYEHCWSFRSGRSLCLTLSGRDWLRLVDFWDDPSRLSMEKAMEIRASVTLASQRRDCRDRWYFKDHSLSARVAKEKFREHGVLLPFGQDCTRFTVPNP